MEWQFICELIIFDLSFFWAITILSAWIYQVICHSFSYRNLLSEGLFLVFNRRNLWNCRWNHSMWNPYHAICSCDFIEGKNLSLMKSREKFRLTSEGSKQQRTSVFALAKHALAEQHDDGWHMLSGTYSEAPLLSSHIFQCLFWIPCLSCTPPALRMHLQLHFYFLML